MLNRSRTPTRNSDDNRQQSAPLQTRWSVFRKGTTQGAYRGLLQAVRLTVAALFNPVCCGIPRTNRMVMVVDDRAVLGPRSSLMPEGKDRYIDANLVKSR